MLGFEGTVGVVVGRFEVLFGGALFVSSRSDLNVGRRRSRSICARLRATL
jgi:hypothetical protein